MGKLGLLWRTVQHLKAKQVVYQIVYRLQRPAKLRLPTRTQAGHRLRVPKPNKPVSWVHGTFTFLNQSVNVSYLNSGVSTNEVDWNYGAYGKLWTYNLNYFDFLNQPNLATQQGLRFIQSFIDQTYKLNDGLDPYPTSLRIINWIQFLCRNRIQDESINHCLVAQVDLLSRRLEYHLAGNHLLENGFALLTAAIYFRDPRWFRKAAKLVRDELATQILNDGSHDERSPMYHQILLDRLLDLVLALQHSAWNPDPSLVNFLGEKAVYMLGWLEAMTFANGDVPMVNDAAWGIASTTEQLLQKAKSMNLLFACRQLYDSGYRMFRTGDYELLADVGPVGPDHQPGHAHADTFSFVLYVDKQPVIVDNGTSTYEIGPRRMWERSTAAHNTVEVGKQNSSEVWAGFRVGRRAKVNVLQDIQTTLTAQHDGYAHLGIIHERAWIMEATGFQLTDRLLGAQSASGVARFYFHPNVSVTLVENQVMAGLVQMDFSSELPVEARLTKYDMAASFNQLQAGQCLELAFTNSLHTIVTITA